MFKTVLLLLLLAVSAILGEDRAQRCARAAKSCVLAPESTEGPYYWNSTVRRNIRERKEGVPLRLRVHVLDTTTCEPLRNTVVDLWHCDAEGIYSHYIAASLGQSNPRPDKSTFLRGQQLTNAEGVAVFETVYPGWYTGRATHVHVKVHVGATVTNIGGALMTRGGHVSYIGQLYFNDSLSDEVAKLSPYAKHTIRRTRNREDFIYSEGKGSTTLVPIQFLTAAGLRGGVQGEITLGINPKAVSTNTWNPEWELQTPPGR